MNKSLPLLTSHFPSLIERNAWYVDKTMFIPLLEKQNSPAIFFLRPRRFGKSLFLSVLDHYYGKQYDEDFDRLFGNLFIGKPENVTPLRNEFLILKFDFSAIDTGDSALVRESFNAKVKIGFNDFNSHYNFLTKEEMEEILEDLLVSGKISESLTLQYNFEKEFTKADAVSLLFYIGLLTIEDHFAGLITFRIPNYVVKQLYNKVG